MMTLALAVSACETAIDPSTGETQTRLTLPFTEANRAAQQQRWERCIQFRSPSQCERTVPGGRPISVPAPEEDSDYTSDERRDP